jgi:methionyl-tRNA synthetase
MPKNFYITTTLPYVNADPHIGFALEIVQADVIARYHAQNGDTVFFNTGTDEHGLKVYQKAREEGKDPQAYTDELAPRFDRLKQGLNLSYNHFIRTTDSHHISAAQEFWKRCAANGDIYSKTYQVKYCVGCELEKTESELEDGHCIIHPNLELEIIDEENYFFRFSKFGPQLLEFYKAHPDFVVPDFRFHEIKNFVENGLQDFSISRLKEKMPWGVPVPGDDTQVMYVWFDALINYISTIGWPEDEANFAAFWGTEQAPGGVQAAGKDNLRQQSAMWQAMLMSAGLPNSKQILIHGFINSGGHKMSKSLGNVIDPFVVLDDLQKLGLTPIQATDALRYFLLREISTFEDSDFTWERFKESYTANLVNGIGNLTSRVMKMAISAEIELNIADLDSQPVHEADKDYRDLLERYELQKCADLVWEHIAWCDRFIQEHEPFKVIKTDPEKARADIMILLLALWQIANWLAPFLPSSSEQITEILKNPKLENIPRLFPRLE